MTLDLLFPDYASADSIDKLQHIFINFVLLHFEPKFFCFLETDLFKGEIRCIYPIVFPLSIEERNFNSIASILEWYSTPHLNAEQTICWKSNQPGEYQYLIIIENVNLSLHWTYCDTLFRDYFFQYQNLSVSTKLPAPVLVQSYFAKLRSESLEIQEKLNSLNAASYNLNQQLLRSQKMLVIGELTPIVANALQQPMQTIHEYSEQLNNSLPLLIVQIPHILQRLESKEENLFWELIDIISKPVTETTYSPPPSQLSYSPQSASNALYAKMTELNIKIDFDHFSPLSQSRYVHKIIFLLEKIYAFGQNIVYIRKSIEKVFEILNALENFCKSATSTPIPVDIEATLSVALTLYEFYFSRGIKIEKKLKDFPQIYGYPQLLIQMWVSLCWHCFCHINFQGKLNIFVATPLINGREIRGVATRDNSLPQVITAPLHVPLVISLERCHSIVMKHGGLLCWKKQSDKVEFSIQFWS
jgi:hypothetical protein